MSRKEFERKIKWRTIIEKKEASNVHWDRVYREELRKKEQERNEKRYALIIKFVNDEFAKRNLGRISKKETTELIKAILDKSKYISERFKRRRASNLRYYTFSVKKK